MTIVVACQKDNEIMMGADMQVTEGGKVAGTIQKIMKFDNVLFGFAGNLRTVQELKRTIKSILDKDEKIFSEDQFDDFVEDLRAAFEDRKKASFCSSDDCEEACEICNNFALLVGCHAGIFNVEMDWSYIKSPSFGEAIGSARDEARAVLSYLKDKNLNTAVRGALSIASQLDTGCGYEYQFETISIEAV